MTLEIYKSVEAERQRILNILKMNGITKNAQGENIENMYLLPLTIFANSLNLNN